jgi:hypothetical protein
MDASRVAFKVFVAELPPLLLLDCRAVPASMFLMMMGIQELRLKIPRTAAGRLKGRRQQQQGHVSSINILKSLVFNERHHHFNYKRD